MTGSIYLIRDVINGKCYVGQTIQNPEDRFK
ncbi:GIY-YIG nuclease family protein [[Anoxybacillus] calidus]